MSKQGKILNKNKLFENGLEKSLSILPKKEGVYIFKDDKGKIIYIGKAINLYNRVRSYFQGKSGCGDTVKFNAPHFADKINSIDYVITDNEVEALVLECNLIKKNKPRYNIELKDDKSYPYIAITESHKYPRVFMTRNRNIEGAKYFGPYTSVKAIKKTLEHLRKIFKTRDCKGNNPGTRLKSPCLNYHIGLCSAPCTGNISESSYKDSIECIKLFLRGKDKTIISRIKLRMEQYSRDKNFEEASKMRDMLAAINNLLKNQKIYIGGEDSLDFISLYKDIKSAAISVFSYRRGGLDIINNFTAGNVGHLKNEEILSYFIKKYYVDVINIPSKIYIPAKIEDMELLSEWLTIAKSKKVEIKIPKIGRNKKIIDMVTKNSRLYLEKKMFERDTGCSKIHGDIIKLRDMLGLKNIPRKIECYDVSNLKNSFPVGSMAVFVDGHSLKSSYRHFKIKTVSRQDDCRMIGEILLRRLKYLEEFKIDVDDSFCTKPDLIIIDGGKAQFNTANALMKEKNISDIDLISIAKKEEVMFCNKYKDGVKLDLDSSYVRIIIKIRDEAHRFALDYHKRLRNSYMTHSVLDEIKGIGSKKKKYIYEKFGTIEELRRSKIEDLVKIKGVSRKDALNIYNSICTGK